MNNKLQDVLLEYGAEGYGLYWYCLELISSTVEKDNLTFELEHDARIIARNLGLGVQRVEEMMKHMVSLDLFEASEGRITCLKLAKRADDYISKAFKENSPQVIESKQVTKKPKKTQKNSLEEKRIEEKRKEKNIRFKPPSLDDVILHCQQTNNPVDPEKFFYHYESNGWMVGKNKMKSWKSAIAGWQTRDKEKPISGTRDTSIKQDLTDRTWAT